MKRLYVTLIMFALYTFNGCGTSSDNITNIQTLDTNKEQNEITKNKITNIDKIRELIKSNKDITYIVVGDSTRSTEDSPDYFRSLQANLSKYGIESYLIAKSGRELSEFVSESGYPTYKDVIEKIPNSGKNTIVDIDLSINDLWDYSDHEKDREIIQARLKRDLKKAISLIKAQKPDTLFLLSCPNPMRAWDQGSSIYIEVYKDISKELDIPFIDFYDEVFKNLTQSQKDTLYRIREGRRDNVHFSRKGQLEMVNFLSKELGLL